MTVAGEPAWQIHFPHSLLCRSLSASHAVYH